MTSVESNAIYNNLSAKSSCVEIVNIYADINVFDSNRQRAQTSTSLLAYNDKRM